MNASQKFESASPSRACLYSFRSEHLESSLFTSELAPDTRRTAGHTNRLELVKLAALGQIYGRVCWFVDAGASLIRVAGRGLGYVHLILT
jgi:hypothetical protein